MENNPHWEKITVEEFMQGNYLQRSDIIVVGGGNNFFSRMIRKFTNSLFSHGALIFLVPDHDKGFNNTFLIESVTSGVDVTPFSDYAIKHKKDRHMAILRLEHEWFSPTIRSHIRGRMLNFIKSDYDYGTILSIAYNILRYKLKLSSVKKSMGKRRVPNKFICSGFIQYGYVKSVEFLKDKENLPSDAIDKVLFHSELNPQSPDSELLSVSPEDLASTNKLKWQYVIKKGMVYKVDSVAQGKAILMSKEV